MYSFYFRFSLFFLYFLLFISSSLDCFPLLHNSIFIRFVYVLFFFAQQIDGRKEILHKEGIISIWVGKSISSLRVTFIIQFLCSSRSFSLRANIFLSFLCTFLCMLLASVGNLSICPTFPNRFAIFFLSPFKRMDKHNRKKRKIFAQQAQIASFLYKFMFFLLFI